MPGSRSSTPARDSPDRCALEPPASVRLLDVLVFPPTMRSGGRGPRTLPPAMRGPLNRLPQCLSRSSAFSRSRRQAPPPADLRPEPAAAYGAGRGRALRG
jgi:hypothetical protein